MKLILLLLFMSFSINVQASCVILLHGLVRTSDSMEVLENSLLKEGFFVVSDDYPSRKYTVEHLAELAIKPALEKCPENLDVNFVTHSLGGILVRQYLSKHKIARLHRVVMLAPPNRGSEVVDKLRDVPGFHYINGDVGLQLGTDKQSIPSTLGKANFEVGVVAGTKSINCILSLLIPGVDDGKVSINNTKIEGMTDHIEMPVTHTFMMRNKKVIAQVLFYLENGRFNHGVNLLPSLLVENHGFLKQVIKANGL